MYGDPNKVEVAWVRPGNQRDGESHAFQVATFDDDSTVVDNISLCGKKFNSMAISKARAHGNTSSEVCAVCKVKSTSFHKTARYEEGKPADPTQNMSEEDAAEWKKQNEENRDNFKSAGLRSAAISEQGLAWDAEDLVAASDTQIRKLQIFTRECKGRADLATPLKYVMKLLVDADASLRRIEHKLKSVKTAQNE
jgi:hypothetical protein